MSLLHPGSSLSSMEVLAGRELGVVRLSLGLGTSWRDVRALVGWVKDVVGVRRVREGLLSARDGKGDGGVSCC